MKPKNIKHISALLDKVEAVFESGGAGKVELAEYLGVPYSRIYERVVARSKVPGGEMTLRIQAWLFEMEQRMKSDEKTISRYNKLIGKK